MGAVVTKEKQCAYAATAAATAGPGWVPRSAAGCCMSPGGVVDPGEALDPGVIPDSHPGMKEEEECGQQQELACVEEEEELEEEAHCGLGYRYRWQVARP